MTKPPEHTIAARGREYQPTPKLMRITPALAEKILENNTLNRSLRAGRVERYAADMAAGNWRMNGETIKMTKGGDLLDGQHRLFAVIEAAEKMGMKTPVEMLVVEGLDADVMPTIDTGLSRQFSDVLSIGGKKNTTVSAAMARWIGWYEASPRATHGPKGSDLSHSKLMTIYEANPDIPERASEVSSAKARSLMAPGILGFVYLMAYRVDAQKAAVWLELLSSGAGMEAKHPVFQLRERLIQNKGAKAKLPPLDIAALGIKSFNQFLSGKRTNTLTWKTVEDFPEFGVVQRPRKRARG